MLCMLTPRLFIIIIILFEKKRKKERKTNDKTNVMTMTKNPIMLERSPFHKQRDETAPKDSINLQAQVSNDVFNDFMTFAQNYNNENPPPQKPDDHMNKAHPLKHIINEFLNSRAIKCECFKDLHVIMAFNNLFDYKRRKSAVIGFVDYPEKFTKWQDFAINTKHAKRFEDSRLAYCPEKFDKDTYDDLNLKSLNTDVLFNIPSSIYEDFDRVRTCLKEQHPDIDFDNADICMFNLNNYLDELKDGVYVKKNSTCSHEGVVVLLEPYRKLERIILRFTWSYNSQTGELAFDSDVEDEAFFNDSLNYRLPCNAYAEYWSISTGFVESERGRLEIETPLLYVEILADEKRLARKKEKYAEMSARLHELKDS